MKNKKPLIFLLSMILLMGCSKMEQDEQQLKFAYITKGLEHYWFVQQKNGIERKCKELGIKVEIYDANFDDEVCMEMVEKVIRDGCDALMICPTNQNLGPEIGKLCEKAGIPIITLDDYMENESGEKFPHIGMATKELGTIAGIALGKLAQEKGFFEEGNRVGILELDAVHVTVLRERLEGYEDALLTNTPLEKEDIQVLYVPDGMYEKNVSEVKKFLQEDYPKDVTHWIICGVNDESALAPVHVLEQAGFNMENVIACGIGGGELSVTEFEKGNPNYIAIMLLPELEGIKAVEMLYENIVNQTPLVNTTLFGGKIATCDNYMFFYNYSKLSKIK